MCIYMYVYVKEVYELYFCITGLKIWAEIFIGDVGDGDRGFELKKNLLSTSVACGLGILFCLDISSIWTWVFWKYVDSLVVLLSSYLLNLPRHRRCKIPMLAFVKKALRSIIFFLALNKKAASAFKIRRKYFLYIYQPVPIKRPGQTCSILFYKVGRIVPLHKGQCTSRLEANICVFLF